MHIYMHLWQSTAEELFLLTDDVQLSAKETLGDQMDDFSMKGNSDSIQLR